MTNELLSAVLKHLFLLIFSAFLTATVGGQADLQPAIASQSWEVYLQPSTEDPDFSTLIFTDLLTGESTSVATSGERYTLFDEAALYFDKDERLVKLVKPDGIIRDHPFMMLSQEDYRIDWAVSGDGQRIAWATSRVNDEGKLSTALRLADAAGFELRQLLEYGPRAGIRLIPVAFNASGDSLYVEVHAEGTEEASAYRQRSGLFALDIGAEGLATRALPGAQTCFCAIGFGSDVMLRLESDSESPGISLEIHDLSSGSQITAPPVSLGSYDEAGNILVSPDGALAVYALSQVSGLPDQDKTINTVIVLADLENASQMVINYPMSALARPIRWTEDNTAILLTQEGHGGTWKMQVDDGATVKLTDSVYMGMIGGAAAR